MELIPIGLSKIMQSRTYTMAVLGTPDKKFAIYMLPHVGQTIQSHLTDAHKPRPMTSDLLSSIFRGFEIRVLQVIINDIEDTIYFARLYLEQTAFGQKQILEIDARPSDAIPIAIMHNAPLFCRREIFDKAVPIPD
jgi:bifunctional DNase/RNase